MTLLFQNCFGYSITILFPCKFWNHFLYIYRKACWDIDWDTAESIVKAPRYILSQLM